MREFLEFRFTIEPGPLLTTVCYHELFDWGEKRSVHYCIFLRRLHAEVSFLVVAVV